jgi:hypothetical protein
MNKVPLDWKSQWTLNLLASTDLTWYGGWTVTYLSKSYNNDEYNSIISIDGISTHFCIRQDIDPWPEWTAHLSDNFFNAFYSSVAVTGHLSASPGKNMESEHYDA